MVLVAEAAEKPESQARVRAAAWAWYQRSGGSVTPAAGRSEAFATRCATRPSTSRFQRESAMNARVQLASQTSSVSDSVLTSFSSISSIDNTSSLSLCTASFGDATDLDDILNPDSSNPDEPIEKHSLDLVTLHTTACWDCGSSLFDSFELVAMSKKLDAELHQPNIDAELGLYTDSELGFGFAHHHNGLLRQQQVLPLCNTPYYSISPLSSPPHLLDAYDTYDKLVSVPDKHSKQAVYDMFCHYGDATKHVTKQTSKVSTTADTACGGGSRKHKPGRMSFHNLSKALHNIRHPGAPQSMSGAAVAQDRHHHHHLNYKPHQQISTEKALSTQANGANSGASRLGERFLYDDANDGLQHKQRHIHHHHHHHYHFLFHSDDNFRMQPLNKSLMVAAAGLRSPKANPGLSNYLESPARSEFNSDYGNKRADFGSIPSPVGSYFQQLKILDHQDFLST